MLTQLFVVKLKSKTSKSQIQLQRVKFKLQRKGTVTEADTIIVQATNHPISPN